MRLFCALFVGVLIAGTVIFPTHAQTPPGAVQPTLAKAAQASSARTALAYDPGNRRDPFVEKPISATPLQGLEGQRIDEVTLKGVTRFGETPFVILLGKDGMGYFATVGDCLADGCVKAIAFDKSLVTFEKTETAIVRTLGAVDVERGLHP